MPCHFTAAFAAGFCTTLVASPVDVVKTRYMNSVPGQYRGALNCALSMLVNEGPTSFYKGYEAWAIFHHMSDYFDIFLYFCRFVPSYLRLGSWNIVMFVTYEQIQRAVMAFQRWQLLPSSPIVFKTFAGLDMFDLIRVGWSNRQMSKSTFVYCCRGVRKLAKLFMNEKVIFSLLLQKAHLYVMQTCFLFGSEPFKLAFLSRHSRFRL